LHLETKPDVFHAFGYGIEVRQELRRVRLWVGRLPRRPRRSREMKVVSIGLTVFGPNKAAQSLYESLRF
jgi:hypothetical protein